MTRTFIAVDLGAEARRALERRLARLSRDVPAVRWVAPANLHLTLAFLGELDAAGLSEAVAASQATAQVSAPFHLALGTFGTFGSVRGAGTPRVIWAGVTGDGSALGQLHARLHVALALRGLPVEARPFRPHLTLARLTSPLDGTALAGLRRELAVPLEGGYPWTADALNVMASELRREGAVYTCLHSIPLAAGAPG